MTPFPEVAMNITDVDDFDEFITLSGYLHPLLVITVCLSGLSVRLVSS